MLYRIIYITVLIAGAIGCSANKKEPKLGAYLLEFNVKDVRIPIHLVVGEAGWSIQNARETINIYPIWHPNDSFCVEMPLFHTLFCGRMLNDSTMTGQWVDPTRSKTHCIPFRASYCNKTVNFDTLHSTSSKWDCTFSPTVAEDRCHAIGLFDCSGDQVQGTFLTETGDYRYLQGTVTDQKLQLSCFDGTHLFYFSALMKGDSLCDGVFLSGNTWEEPWNGHLDPNAQLRDPDSLTQLRSNESFRFKAMNLAQETVEFDSASFRDHVTIVQIFGSWCPNCTDESKFLQEIHTAYADQNLQIIPVAFEREASITEQLFRIQRQFSDLGLRYAPYLGGTSPKTNAQITFPQLNHVISYPTTIFIDKKGQVRKIHTGFYGPGTGKYHLHHKEQLVLFIEQLLNEN